MLSNQTKTPAYDISELLKQVALDYPSKPAIIASDLELSYYKINLLVEAYAFKLRQADVGSHDCITVNSSDAIVSIVAIFAIALVGATYIPFAPGIDHLREPKVSVCLRTEEKKPFEPTTNLVIDGSWSPKNFPDGLDFHSKDRPHSINPQTWIVPSSGTTGRQKYSPLSTGLLHARLDAIAADYQGDHSRVLLLFMPGTRPFVIRAVAALTHGKTIVDSRDTAFAIEKRVTVVCASPQQITAWLKDLEFTSKIPVLQFSGAKLPKDSIKRMLKNFEIVEDVYGANETIKSHVNVYRIRDGELHCYAKPDQKFVQIADSAGNPCKPGIAGTIRVKSPFMTDRYLDDEDATSKAFRDGWFYPGDLGIIDKYDVLDIIGRTDEVINVGGEKYLLNDIDEVLSNNECTRYACAFKKPISTETSEIVACIVLAGPIDRETAVLRVHQTAIQKLPPKVVPKTFLVVDELDVNPDSVPIRRKAQAQFIAVVSRADPIELSQRLFHIREGE